MQIIYSVFSIIFTKSRQPNISKNNNCSLTLSPTFKKKALNPVKIKKIKIFLQFHVTFSTFTRHPTNESR